MFKALPLGNAGRGYQWPRQSASLRKRAGRLIAQGAKPRNVFTLARAALLDANSNAPRKVFLPGRPSLLASVQPYSGPFRGKFGVAVPYFGANQRAEPWDSIR